MDYEYLINATPFELWKRAEAWEENARSAQEEVAELTHRLEETQDELRSREEAVIGMEAERDAQHGPNSAPDLYEELVNRLAQTMCGCDHPHCKRCEDDRITRNVLAKTIII